MTFTGSPSRILLVTGEPIADSLAGPAIRSWQMAGALAAAGHAVTVASTGGVTRRSELFTTAAFTAETAMVLVDDCDVLIFQGSFYASMPWLAEQPQVQIMDLYDPFHLEFLYTNHDLDDAAVARRMAELTRELNAQLGRADLVLCASDRQRDLWLGQLAGLGRLRVADSGQRDALLRIVPFGTPDEQFPAVDPSTSGRRASVIRTPARGIGPEDLVLLWAGGLYDWFDPQTLIRAVEVARHSAPAVKLFFLASAHPNLSVDPHGQAAAARTLAAELGVLDTHVFFNDGWVPYADRVDYLAEADIGVTTHPDSLETRFSFRTRNLDYLWAGLPIVTSGGDVFAELVDSTGAGAVVPAGDVEALAAVLVEAAEHPELRAQWARASAIHADRWRWGQVLRPLVEFMDAPRRSPVPPWPAGSKPAHGGASGRPGSDRGGVVADLRTTLRHLRSGGFTLLWRRLKARRQREALRRPHP